MASPLAHSILLVMAVAAYAQDTRDVKEPHYPQVCRTLTARLTAPGGVLADASEKLLDTPRIQDAIDHCVSGEAVELGQAGGSNVFLTAPIHLKAGVTLLIDDGVALFASRNPRDYDITPGSCGVVNQKGHGCQALILAERAPGSGIMGGGAIDGRGGAKLLGEDLTWWDLAHEAKVKDLSQSVPRILIVRQSDNFTLYRITLRNSPNFHVSVERTDGFTAWGVTIHAPKTARNTDGIDPSSSKNVTIAHCDISTGDDNVAIKSSSAGGSASHITVTDNHFYYGHGMSIGSNTDGGVSAVRVTGLSIDGADNGIRIKSDRSRGGLVEDVSYENVCMKSVVNPIVITPLYTTFSGEKLPVYRDIRLKDVHSLTPGRLTLMGLDAAHKLDMTLDNVWVDGERPESIRARDAEIRIGQRRGNLAPSGDDVSLNDANASKSTPSSCDGRFVPFTETSRAPASAMTIPPEDKTLYVATTGTGDYSSIQRAIDSAPPEGAVISIGPGAYREVLTIAKRHIHLRGVSPDASKTVVVFDNSAKTTGSTFKSATVNVTGDDFLAENVTFANDWNATHAQEQQGSQALALLITGDRAVFRNVRLLGNQDTLYTGNRDCGTSSGPNCSPSRQYFTNCYIEGNVDFIFGDGNSVFDHCELHSTTHNGGFVTAQGKHYADEQSLFLFDHCKLTAEPGVEHVWLGRPWRPFANVVFLNTEMGAHIERAGWREWHPGETHYLDTASYAEYNSTGPGANIDRDPHVKLLTREEAERYETALMSRRP